MFFIIDTNVDSADDGDSSGKIKRSAEQGISYIYFKTCIKVQKKRDVDEGDYSIFVAFTVLT